MGDCGHRVPIKQEVPCIQCVEELQANIDWITKESRHYQNKYQIEESANIEMEAELKALREGIRHAHSWDECQALLEGKQ